MLPDQDFFVFRSWFGGSIIKPAKGLCEPFKRKFGDIISVKATGYTSAAPAVVRFAQLARMLRANGTPANEVPFAGGLNAVQDAFDPILHQLFEETGTGEFQGTWLNRMVETQFHDRDLAIYFQREAHITGRVVGEEVQHAIDFRMGVTKRAVIDGARPLGIADDQIVLWWHRRVFTRLLQNIEANQFNLGVLRPYAGDIYSKYLAVGGKLRLEDYLVTKLFWPFLTTLPCEVAHGDQSRPCGCTF